MTFQAVTPNDFYPYCLGPPVMSNINVSNYFYLPYLLTDRATKDLAALQALTPDNSLYYRLTASNVLEHPFLLPLTS